MTCLKIIGPTAFRTFRCIWMLEELQVPYEHVTAKPWSKTAKQYHPMGKIPALVHGEFTLYESAAILTYLGDTFGNKLVPTSPKERAIYNQTTLFIMTEMDAQALWIHRKHEALSKVFGAAPTAVEQAKQQFDSANKVLSKQICNPGPYLLGTDFTAADILYVHCLDWAKSIGWFQEQDSAQNLQTYLDLCRQRPAYQRTLAKQQAEKEQAKQEKKTRSKI